MNENAVQNQTPVYFVSLGCPKNLVDSQVMLGKLEQSKYAIVKDPKDAEVIIVNTCSFIQASKEESLETIFEMAEYKENGKCKILVASGCLPQRYAKDLEKQIPEVDLFIGTGQYHRITEALEKVNRAIQFGDPLPNRSYVDQPAFIHTENDVRVHTGPKYTGYLKLSEGCNRRCSFCIIPKLRGNVRSRSVQSLVYEAKQMAKQGVRELNLVAQDLTEYGMEWKYRERLETLLPELCKVEGIEWIRLHYVYPDQFSDELLEIMACEPKIVKYLDMPIQHTNDRVLRLMNRRLTREKLFSLVGKLREKIPEIVFRTSIIVGFPTETEEEFQQLCDDLVQLDLDHVGVFQYSKEEGTKAAEMDGQVHPATKRRRAKRLIEILEQQRLVKNRKYIGKKMTVMIEGRSDETDLLLQGRLPIQAQDIDGHVLINEIDDREHGDRLVLFPGDMVEVEITDAHSMDLVGTVRRLISRSPVTEELGSVETVRMHAQ